MSADTDLGPLVSELDGRLQTVVAVPGRHVDIGDHPTKTDITPPIIDARS